MRTFKIDILDERAFEFLKYLHAQGRIKITEIEDDQGLHKRFDPAFSLVDVKEMETLLYNLKKDN